MPLGGDHRAAGLDLRGHGSSGRPPDRDYAWPRIGRDVREILDAAPGPLRVFGHSLGANAALLAALERPEAIRSLCLFEPVILDPRDSSRIEEMAQRTEGRRAAFAYSAFSVHPPRGLEAIRSPLPRRRTSVVHVVKTALMRAPAIIIPVHRRPCE
jgi:pimeloyl-ACP methyl ester carboxylesterase